MEENIVGAAAHISPNAEEGGSFAALRMTEKRDENVSFRGGQSPTWESASPAPLRMTEEAPSAEEAERFAAWRAQAEQAKALYPDLDLGAELEGERFRSLLLGGVDVQTAFEATHREALLQSVMREATLAAEKRIAARFLVSRPAENGLAAASPAVSKVDVAKLSRQQRKALIRRAQAGEKIRL